MGLTVSHLSKKYGNKTVLEDLSFEMQRPGVYALLGTNGAGKTTAIRMMLNMLSRDSGEVLWNGAPLDTASCNVGYLAEERGLYPKYTLMDQLIYFAQLRGVNRAEAKRRIRYWSERLELDEYLYPTKPIRRSVLSRNSVASATVITKSKKADQLSKGNQQKIQLMTALLPDPELIIRPSGEYRLSNFLIWQAAYSEFWFSNVLWPDFTPDDLERAIDDFNMRNRRFGGV